MNRQMKKPLGFPRRLQGSVSSSRFLFGLYCKVFWFVNSIHGMTKFIFHFVSLRHQSSYGIRLLVDTSSLLAVNRISCKMLMICSSLSRSP